MSLHTYPHALAGNEARIVSGSLDHRDVTILDWYDRVAGRSWRVSCVADPEAHAYAFRSIYGGLPLDDEVVLGILRGGRPELLHASELPEPLIAIAARDVEGH